MESKKHYLLELIDRYNSPDIFNDTNLLPNVKEAGKNMYGHPIYIEMTSEEREQYRQERIKRCEDMFNEYISSLKHVGKKWYAVCGQYGKPEVMTKEVVLENCMEVNNRFFSAYVMIDLNTGLCICDDGIMYYQNERLFDTNDAAKEYCRKRLRKESEEIKKAITKKQERLQYLEKALCI